MVTSEKVSGIVEHNGNRQIAVSHVTIRESISFLLLRLVTLEIIAGICITFLHSTLAIAEIGELHVLSLLSLIFAKTVVMIYVILQWLNEYYEITPDSLIHRHGIIYVSQHEYKLEHLGSVKLEQGLIGRIFNYGTLRLFHTDLNTDVIIYLIHNPVKYYEILQTVLPTADEGKKVFREHLIEHSPN